MFGVSARSVSSPIRGYVCSACLGAKNATQRQTVRFASAAVAHADEGDHASDPVLHSIGGLPKEANEDSAAADVPPGVSTPTPSTCKTVLFKTGSTKKRIEASQKLMAAKRLEAGRSKNIRKVACGRGRSAQEPSTRYTEEELRSMEAKGTLTPELKLVADAPKRIKDKKDPSTFVKTLKSLRARPAAKPKASKGDEKGSGKKKEGARRSLETDSINAQTLKITALDTSMPKVPKLSYGLDRVLFNPGVYHLQDPRSRVYNFDPYLGSIMPVSEFDFEALNDYITSSKDKSLHNLASSSGKKYVGSSSSMTSVLSHFHYLLSHWREINTSSVSQGFPGQLRSFTKFLRGPTAVFLRYNNGVYAIDADKEFDDATVLMNLGRSMEKLLTLPTQDFERYRRTNKKKASEQDQNDPEAYHYSTMGDFVMRSQLDAYDPRLPGTGMFDLKTRAVVSIRMHTKKPEKGQGYQIKGRFGGFESYEREYYDMIRSAFLKYSLQVRIGRMDGIFVAFHNIERIFGFQYISLPEMDQCIHGQENTLVGDKEFKLSVALWNKILNKATERFPKQSLRFHFETREGQSPFMYIFAEPVSEEEINDVQNRKADEIEAIQKRLLYPELAQEKPDTATSDAKSNVNHNVDFDFEDGKGFQSLENALAPKKARKKSAAGKSTTVTESGTVNPDGSSTPNNITTQYDSESATDSEFLDGLEKTDEANLKPLMGMILTTENKVNGSTVVRPDGLKQNDKWEVDYKLTEITSLARAWTVYAACQSRRAALVASVDEEEGRRDMYLDKLKELSVEGQKWRKRQDEIDRDYGTIVLDLESKKSSSAEEEPSSRRQSSSSSKPPDSSRSSLTSKFLKFFS